MKKFIPILLSLMLLCGCETQKPIEVDSVVIPEITHHNYFEVEDKSILWNNVFNIYLYKYFVYYYSPTCSHCAERKDWIIDKALKREDIYFVKASELDVLKSNVSSSIGATKASEICILGYPSLIEIINGKVVKNVAGKTEIKKLIENS